MTAALLVLDPQNDFFEADNPNLDEFWATVPVINAAIAEARAQGWRVIFVQHISKNKPVGSRAWAIGEQFDCRAEDVRVLKSHYNAFWKTELDDLLKNWEVDLVVVCRYVAEYCVLSTLRGALERGFRAVALEQGIAGMEPGNTQFTLTITPHISLDAIR